MVRKGMYAGKNLPATTAILHCRKLAPVGRNDSDFRSETCMDVRINGSVPHLGARRVFAKIVIAFPVFRRPDGTGRKTTSAIRTDVAQNDIHTRRAERAFIAADACLTRFGRQRLVAVLAGWSEFKHGASLSKRLMSHPGLCCCLQATHTHRVRSPDQRREPARDNLPAGIHVAG